MGPLACIWRNKLDESNPRKTDFSTGLLMEVVRELATNTSS